MLARWIPVLAAVLAVATCAHGASLLMAVCVLATGDGTSPNVNGTIRFSQADASSNVTVTGAGSNFPPGNHGIHVHAIGDVSSGSSTGGHFNPSNVPHGCWPNPTRHFGDIGNVSVDSTGYFSLSVSRDLLQLSGPNSIIGRAIVIHALGDTCTGATGNAGSRIAQCVIGLQSVAATDTNIGSFSAPSAPKWAVAKISPMAGMDVQGYVYFRQTNTSTVRAYARYSAATSLAVGSQHGFHVHDFGDLSDALGPGTAGSTGAKTGGHWNPLGQNHAWPTTTARHSGDMGNVTVAADATIIFNKNLDLMTLTGSPNIYGRTVLLHANPDDGVSQPTGNAGAKMAAGVIGYIAAPQATARAVFYSTKGVVGTFTLTQSSVGPGDPVVISGSVTGLTPGKHALMINQYGDITTTDGQRTGAIFDPDSRPHNCAPNTNRSAGILGPITADANGAFTFAAATTLPLVDLSGLRSVVGRALVIYEFDDPLCGGSNAIIGSIVAQAVIAISNPNANTQGPMLGMNGAEFDAPQDTAEYRAVAYLTGPGGVSGSMFFEGLTTGNVQVYALINGMAPGTQHGYHLYEFGDATNVTLGTAGAHFNPNSAPHALPPTTPRHIGDYGNLDVHADRVAYIYSLFPGGIKGLDSITGRLVVIQTAVDNGEQPSGGPAGTILATGIVGICGSNCWPSTLYFPSRERANKGLSAGAIALIVVCVLVSIAAVAVGVFVIMKQCKKEKPKAKGSRLSVI